MFDVVRALYICFFRYGTSPIRTEYTMSDRRNQIMHRQVGHTEKAIADARKETTRKATLRITGAK